MRDEHIVVIQNVVTTSSGFDWTYYWDGQRFPSKLRAIYHGFKLGRSDDFNVAVVRGNQLVWFGWMDEELDRNILPQIAEKIGLEAVDHA